MSTRRDFIRATALGATAAVLPSTLPAATAPASSAKLSPGKSGPGALTARHRNLFNGDTCVYFYNPEMWQPEDFTLKVLPDDRDPSRPNTIAVPVGGPFSSKSIHRYVDKLADNGVDTFVINANASRAWYPSKVIPSILDGYKRGDREFFRGHAICAGVTGPVDVERFIDRFMAFFNLYQDLLDAGVDWLAETARACRRRGVSPWVSIRMNDFHGHRNIQGSFFNLPLLKQDDMRLKHSTYSPTMRDPSYRSGLNYERPEVRAVMFAQIKEVVEDYDYEGLELDWWRQPLCCEPNATPETVAMMSAWIREIKALTERRARTTGRPYPLGLRIPGRLETMKSIGLDVVTLCREGTIDFICPSNFWCTSWDMPHDALRRELGDTVAIYGVIEDGANALPTQSADGKIAQRLRYISASREILRGNAAGKLALGADGIEWFNFYCTDQSRIPGLQGDYAALRDIDRLDWLRGRPKHYSFSIESESLVLPPFDLPAQLPVQLEHTWSHSFRVPMCAEPAAAGLELVVQIVIRASDVITQVPVSFNGCWPRLAHTRSTQLLFPCGSLTHHAPAHVGLNFVFPVGLVRDGWNEVVVENGGNQAILLVCIELAVRPVSRPPGA